MKISNVYGMFLDSSGRYRPDPYSSHIGYDISYKNKNTYFAMDMGKDKINHSLDELVEIIGLIRLGGRGTKERDVFVIILDIIKYRLKE